MTPLLTRPYSNALFCIILDLDDEVFFQLKPHHIKEIIPKLSERIAFEHRYERFKELHLDNVSTTSLKTITQDTLLFPEESESENVPEDCQGIENYRMESPFNVINENNANGSEILPEYPNYILYQNLNVRSSADIISIQSVDLKIVLQKYHNDDKSLENNDRISRTFESLERSRSVDGADHRLTTRGKSEFVIATEYSKFTHRPNIASNGTSGISNGSMP